MTAGGGGLLFLGHLFEENLEPLTPSDIDNLSKDDVNGFDRWVWSNWSPDAATASDLFLYGNLTLPLTLLLSSEIRGDAGLVGWMYLETLMLTSAGMLLSKALVGRTRPFAYNPDVDIEDKIMDNDARKSFYSGHTALAFSSAVFFSKVLSDYYPESRWIKVVWGGSLGVAALVGFLRMQAGKHFPTDVLAGAVMGGVTGYLVPFLHESDRKNKAAIFPSTKKNVTVITFVLHF